MNPVIEVSGLTKRYKGAKETAVNGVSFSVAEGEFFAFLGPNGAGKTTTISILTTTLSKTGGTVKIAGFDLEGQTRQIRENVGIIFQKPSLDHTLSAENNIRFHACLYGMYPYRPAFGMMPTGYKNRVMELAEIVGIKDVIFKPVKKMSGGTRRKLEIIRSLIHTPKILFLDEPTQGLDAVSRRSLWNYIDNVRKENGTTVFLTTHYIDEAENVDNVCVINHGQIVMSGSPDEMKSSLLRQSLILDAKDRQTLIAEISSLGLPFKEEKHLLVDIGDTNAQEIISRLKTKLSVLRVSDLTLEDAYIELLKKTGG